jgi:eight-cysteine-cluster-containing protein
MTFALVLLLACAKDPVPAEVDPAPPAAEVPAPPPSDPGFLTGTAPVAEPITDPQAAYASCKERVEGPGAAGECTSDEGCVKVGCSSEVCVSVASGVDFMSSCDKLPCFEVLKSCGCIEGQCSWTVGAPEVGAPEVGAP